MFVASTLAPSPRKSTWGAAPREIEGGLSPLLFQEGGQELPATLALGEWAPVGWERVAPILRPAGREGWWPGLKALAFKVALRPFPRAKATIEGPAWVPPSSELGAWGREVQALCARAREQKANTRIETWALAQWWISQGYSLAQVKSDARRILGEWEKSHPCPQGRAARLAWREKRSLQVQELRACKRAWLNATARDRWAERGASAQKALEARLDRASGARPLSPKEEQALLAPSQDEANALLLAWQERAQNPRLPGPRPEGLGRLGPGWGAPLIKDEALAPKSPKRGVLAESQAKARALAREAKAELARGCEPLTLAEADQLRDERASELISQAELAQRLRALGVKVKRGRPRKG